VENLEETKRTAGDIAERVAAARVTEASLSTAREVYRPVAARGALVYFLIDGLHALDRWGAGTTRGGGASAWRFLVLGLFDCRATCGPV
jgi:hypothetical protein